MIRRTLLLVSVALLVGCSDASNPLGVAPLTQPEEKPPAEDEAVPSGVDKCAVYRTREVCQLP